SIQSPSNFEIDPVSNAAVTPLKNVTANNIAALEKNLQQGNKKYSDVFQNWQRTQLMSSYVKLNDHVNTSIAQVNSNIQKLPFQNQPLILQSDNSILPIHKPVEL